MKRDREQFTHLHVHSDASQLDGAAKIEDYVKAAAERGNPAVALTDHGTLRGLYTLTQECDKHRVKPIYGVELYVCPDMNRRGLTEDEKEIATRGIDNKAEQRAPLKTAEEERGIRKTWHLTAWALDNEGLRNLYRLTSKAWNDGFYYRPRVDLAAIEEFNKGLAIGTGCAGSVVYSPVINGKPREADVTFGRLNEIFGDRLYLEVMTHSLKDRAQQQANQFALALRSVGQHRLLATQDSHYIKQKDARHHDVLLAIGTHSALGDYDRFRFDGDQFWFATRSEVEKKFHVQHPYFESGQVAEALASTVELAERCTAQIEIDPHKCLLPTVEIPEGFVSELAYLSHLVRKGFADRKLAERAEDLAVQECVSYDKAMSMYVKRAQHEMRVLRDSEFISYFLVLYDLFEWAKSQGIATGPGRGSAAGSLVSYLLGITHVDPLEHRLMFERFIAPGRINMPDIDCDFEDARRGEVVDYLKQKYGSDRVAQISTTGRMQGRQVLKDVSRAYEVPFQRASVASGAIMDTEGDAIDEALQRSSFFRDFQKEYPEVLSHAKALEGLSKSAGLHAAGVVTSPVPLVDVIPLETRRTAGGKEVVVTAYDMHGVEGVGLLKIDVLGLKGVTILNDARGAVSETIGEELLYADLPLNDPATLEGFTLHDFVGIFQFDTPSSHSVCEGLIFTCYDDLVAVNAINRPGALAFADEYKKRKVDPAAVKRVMYHPKVSQITDNAYGLMIYQEHVIRICTDVAGFTPAEADKLRKKIGKSEGEEALEKDRHKFVEGCRKTTEDMDRDTAERLFDSIRKFGRYGFNRSHSVCYSLLAYRMMWLKRHYPLEFYWALMRRESDTQKIQRYARDAKEHGIATRLADVNVSDAGFSLDRALQAVRGSLLEIKGVGKTAVAKIVSERDDLGEYKDIIDFISRVRSRAVTKKTVEALARSGALDSLLPNPRWFVHELDREWKNVERNKIEQLRMAVERSGKKHQWDEKQRLIVAAEVNPLAVPPHPLIEWGSWFQENVKMELSPITDELLAEESNVYVAGVVRDVEERTVGDTKGIEDFPDKATQKVIGWGEPWVRLTLETVEGVRFWVKIDWTLVNEFKDIIDKGQGTLMMVCARTRPEWQNLDAHFIADIESVATKLKEDRASDLEIWERLFVEKYHPATTYPWPSKGDRRLADRNPATQVDRAATSFSVIGVISHLFWRPDKNGRIMAFFGVAGLRGYLNVMCFSSSWPDYNRHLKLGVFAKLKLKKLNGGACCLESRNDGLRLLRRE